MPYMDDFMMNGMRFVTRPGRCNGDEKLYVDTAKLIPVEMAHVAVITHRVCMNEEKKYPRSRGLEGGQMFLDFLRCAAEEGPIQALEAFELRVSNSLREAVA